MTTTELGAVLDVVRSFVDSEVIPVEARFLEEGFDGVLSTLLKLRGQVKDMGLWTPHLPGEVGGPGLSLVEFAQVSERLRPLGGRGSGRMGVPGGPGKRAAAPTVARPGGC